MNEENSFNFDNDHKDDDDYDDDVVKRKKKLRIIRHMKWGSMVPSSQFKMIHTHTHTHQIDGINIKQRQQPQSTGFDFKFLSSVHISLY